MFNIWKKIILFNPSWFCFFNGAVFVSLTCVSVTYNKIECLTLGYLLNTLRDSFCKLKAADKTRLYTKKLFIINFRIFAQILYRSRKAIFTGISPIFWEIFLQCMIKSIVIWYSFDDVMNYCFWLYRNAAEAWCSFLQVEKKGSLTSKFPSVFYTF